MKKQETYRRCEGCDKMLLDATPPKKEYYEEGQIHIGSGTILLPAKVAKRNKKKGFSISHADNLDGYYCNLKCFIRRVNEILLGAPTCDK